ncbi:MAG: bifunctional pyr operon transcriptional regulator/uracil phosphoribosyltransferase PyrR [Verrucomicrobiales bacterium]|nr:bifunctional pyr operon transcriptional regulator/uracil phosphoribosyltransferase PyrR [Verrucomicrobiales bacterium]
MSDSQNITTEELLSPERIESAVISLAGEIRERCGDNDFAFVGIYTRGVTLAKRVAAVMAESGLICPVGTLDISLYRDDFDNKGTDLPRLESSDIPFPIDGTRVILFDEVIFTGRTIRAALDGLMDYGRPSKIELAVLVDRGHREIPIQPDYVGETVSSELNQYVKVRFIEDDNKEGVFLVTKCADKNE